MKSNRVIPLLLCAALLLVGGSVRADYVISFNNVTFENTLGNPGWMFGTPAPPYLIGTLTAVQADFVMDAQTGGVWNSDLAIFITNQNDIQLAANGGSGLLQVGGFSATWGAAERHVWGAGDNTNLGESLQVEIILDNPITFNGDASDPNVMLGNLWDSTSSGTWTGTITMIGVSQIPEPSTFLALSVACMGLGLMRRRR